MTTDEFWGQRDATEAVGAVLPVAIGASWAIGVEDETIASTIANALGGSVVHARDYCTTLD